MKTINLKKSQLAQMRGLGYNVQAIAKHFSITAEETVEALKQLGLYKTKTTTKTKDYVVTTEDDTNNGVPTFVTATELETAN